MRKRKRKEKEREAKGQKKISTGNEKMSFTYPSKRPFIEKRVETINR